MTLSNLPLKAIHWLALAVALSLLPLSACSGGTANSDPADVKVSPDKSITDSAEDIEVTSTPDPSTTGPTTTTGDWVVSPDGLGPFTLGMSGEAAIATGEAVPSRDGICGEYLEFRRNMAAPVSGDNMIYWSWSAEKAPAQLTGIFIKHGRRFLTVEGVGIGSTRAELERAYGSRLATTTFDWVIDEGQSQLPVVYGTKGALVFIMEGDKVNAMQILKGRPGEVLENLATGC